MSFIPIYRSAVSPNRVSQIYRLSSGGMVGSWATLLSIAFLAACSLVWSTSGHADDSASLPSWRRGISEWNGSGYEFPNTPIANPSSANGAESVGRAPYTMPVDLSAGSNASPSFGFPAPAQGGSNAVGSNGSNDFGSSSGPALDQLTTSLNSPVTTSGASPTIQARLTDNGKLGSSGDSPHRSTVAPSDINVGGTPTTEENAFINQLSASDMAETAPLQEQVVRWYEYPRQWMKGWNSSAEFGIDGSNGNADTLALQTGLEIKRKTKQTTMSLDFDYRQASSRNTTVEDNGRFNTDYDYIFKQSPWSAFSKFGMEWDKFKAFDLRLNINGGLGYYWIRRDDATFVTRFGAGASKEIGSPVDDWIPEAVFGIEAERQLTSRQKIKGKVDYFPAWENFDDYRLVSDVSWEILLDGSDNLSLKLAASDRYDSTPQGAKPNDVYYSLLLLYKF